MDFLGFVLMRWDVCVDFWLVSGFTAWGGGDDDKSQKDLWSFDGGSEFRPHILQVTPTKNKNKHADPSKKKNAHQDLIYIYIHINHHLIKDCYRDFWSIPSPLAQFYHFGYCFHVFFFRTWNPRQWADLWPWTLTANAWPKRTKRTWGKKGRDTLITSLWPVCAIEEVVF